MSAFERLSDAYCELDHTADWALEVRGPTLCGALEAAARGMYEMEGADAGPNPRPIAFDVEARDDVSRLVGFLSELLYLQEVERSVATDLTVESTVDGLSVEGEGRDLAGLDKEIKAVTWHAAALERQGDEWIGRVTFDV
ncbi:MAG: archease [Bradymonadaceae bacterium]